MKIPYGVSNFKKIITQNYLYIDKTGYIETLEQQGSLNILLRPRRFGKSLFLSMLCYYYDISFKDEFDALFGNLAIGNNPTPLKNSYQVLALDFSGISTKNAETITLGFDQKVKMALYGFFKTYNYPDECFRIMEEQPSAETRINAFFELVSKEKIYLLIDEYDNFANAILGESQELFQDIVGKGGFVRAFYENIKSAVGRGIVDRFFITGVTSIALDSMTSGFNIARNLSQHKDFNQAIGFSNDEVKTIIQTLTEKCDFDQKDLMADMNTWYCGYRFNALCPDRVFSAGMIIYFIDRFCRQTCCFPEEMLDDANANYDTLKRIFHTGDREKNFAALEKIITNGEIIGQHTRTFELDINKNSNYDNLLSLLLQMGFITISDMDANQLRYTIPNYVIKRLYFEFYRKEIEHRAKYSEDK